MDRFIDIVQERLPDGMTNLKSNMDRFIVIKIQKTMSLIFYLKSNMDRFIGVELNVKSVDEILFKIQYG